MLLYLRMGDVCTPLFGELTHSSPLIEEFQRILSEISLELIQLQRKEAFEKDVRLQVSLKLNRANQLLETLQLFPQMILDHEWKQLKPLLERTLLQMNMLSPDLPPPTSEVFELKKEVTIELLRLENQL